MKILDRIKDKEILDLLNQLEGHLGYVESDFGTFWCQLTNNSIYVRNEDTDEILVDIFLGVG